MLVIIKGPYLVNKRIFLKNKGLDLILRSLSKFANEPKLLARLFTLLHDLIIHENFLVYNLDKIEDEQMNISKLSEEPSYKQFHLAIVKSHA